ncbi:MAG TPA: biopolymer transporter ExbD [Candidatus Angelobacter sp.]|nr:biopolymer transporter ExbD [Candidatus Angelobacter sp.]
MSMTTGARNGASAEINVTPLIDVLLVLLIIFMVILPPHTLGELAQIPQPSPDNKPVILQAPIVIELKDTGEGQRPTLTLNQQQVKWEDLELRLKDIYRAREDRTGFVKSDPDVEYAFVAEVVDISHRAGADRVGLLGKKD